MIKRFKNFSARLHSVSTRGTSEIAKDTIKELPSLTNLAIKLNKEQILSGIDSKGNPTGKYADRTAINRKRFGLQTSHKDYNFTGNFFSKFYVVVVPFLNYIFKIDSKDSKRDKIINGNKNTPPAGEDLFGLTEESLAVFRESFKPKFIIRLRNAIRFK